MGRCGCTDAASAIGVTDTPSIDLTLAASILSAAAKLDPNPDNLLKILAGGLSVSCSDIAACAGGAADVGVTDSPGIDFTTSGAGTQASPRLIGGDTKGVFFQTSAITFSHALGNTNDAYEKITELPDLVLATPGTYIAVMEVVGVAAITGSTAQATCSAYAQLRRNGVGVPNTETRLSSTIQGTAAAAQPSLGVAATGSATRVVISDGTTALSVWAAPSENPAGGANQATITSDSAGRTRITAWRIGA